MPHYTLLLTVALTVSADMVAAQENSALLENFYHNTWNVYTAQGVSHYYINEDHTWFAETVDRRISAGTWRMVGTKACFQRPKHGDECFDVRDRKVGVPWILTEEKEHDSDGYEDYVCIIHPGREYDILLPEKLRQAARELNAIPNRESH